MTISLGRAQARRVTLVAQGFRDPRPARATLRTFDRTLGRTGVLQVDSVNVLQRAHYMPLFSRMGPYDLDLLRRASQQRPRRVVEYWAHVQALMPVDLWPVMQHRMRAHRHRRGKWSALNDVGVGLVEEVLRAVDAQGPVTARDLDHLGAARGAKEHWGWNWSQSRRVLDYLFAVGDVAIAGRNAAFEPRYDLPERVLPPAVLAASVPSAAEASRELVRRAARSHGIATAGCLADYYRMRVTPEGASLAAGPAIAELVEAGELLPARVEGWARPAYLHRDALLPRTVTARALVSPFDPLVWERERTERLFGFRYRIEIYVPAALREYGYYVLPFLLGDRIVARVDLKAERRSGTLLVQAAYAEQHAPAETAAELVATLWELADWLGLVRLQVEPRGDLATSVAREASARRRTGGTMGS